MAININNHEADRLTRQFADMEGVGLTDAIIIAMKEAIELRRSAETPRETASRLRQKHGILLPPQTTKPLPKSIFDDMWDAS